MKQSTKLGIYVHLPFCRSKCAYCDFYSLPSSLHSEEQMNQYQKALLAHISLLGETARGYSVDTVYFGGGTPTFYGAKRLEALVRAVKKNFRVERDAEITAEGNPESIDQKTLQIMGGCGINRLSLGMQSAQVRELNAVGRPHSPQTTRDAVALIKASKIQNFSLDLIYGLPEQTVESWHSTLEEAIALEPTHLSCYGLKVEENTPLWHRVASGELLPDEDSQATLYLQTVQRLKEVGFVQYEISNFAKKDKVSRHNLGYWLGKPYLGFGASASSDFAGYRATLVADLSQYCQSLTGEGLERGEIFAHNQLMTQQDRQAEYLFLRLRTSFGISGSEYEKLCNLDFNPLHQLFLSYEKQGWAVPLSGAGAWRFTAEGFLRSNMLLSQLLEAQEISGKPQKPPLIICPEKSVVDRHNSAVTLQEDDFGQFRFWDS